MKLRTLATLLGALILAASCTSGTEGIFASIEREEKIISLGGLSKTATVNSMVELTAVGKYFATGGKALFSRSTASDSTTWNKSTVKGSPEVAAVGIAGSAVYAVAGEKLYSSTDGSTWSDALTLATGDTAYNLLPVRKPDGQTNDALILVTMTGSSFPNLYLIDAAGLNATPLALAKPAGWTGTWAPWDAKSAVSDGTNLYVSNSNFLWQITPGFTSSTVVSVSNLPVGLTSGLLYLSSTSTLYLSTVGKAETGGGIYSVAGPLGTSLSFTAIKESADNSVGDPISFGKMFYNATNNSIWVATGAATTVEGSGYTEVTLPSTYSLKPVTNHQNYDSSDLPTAAVETFFLAADGTYFLGTVAHGLWTWNSTAKTWSQQ